MPDGEGRAAFDHDEMMDRSLDDMSAADFIRVLDHESANHPGLRTAMIDKKKVELWVDETPVFKIPLRDLLKRLQTEKKKAELEPGPWLDAHVLPAGQLVDNAALADAVAERVATRLRQG